MLNKRIKELRIAHRLTQVQLAAQMSVSKQSVSNWENDNIQPSIDILIKLADLFAVSTDYLLGREDVCRLDVSLLDSEETAHIQQIVHDIQKHKLSPPAPSESDMTE